MISIKDNDVMELVNKFVKNVFLVGLSLWRKRQVKVKTAKMPPVHFPTRRAYGHVLDWFRLYF